MIINQKKEYKMSNVKNMKNDEIQEYININTYMNFECVKELYRELLEDMEDNTKEDFLIIATPRIEKLLKPTPRDIRLATDDFNNFDYEFAYHCFSEFCPVVNDIIDCASCSYYKKYPTIDEAFKQAVNIRTLEILDYLKAVEYGDYGALSPKRKNYIKENNRDLNYLIKRWNKIFDD